MGCSWQLIAEVKTQSPFGYRAKKSWQELFDIASTYGDIVSIHTDPRWGGSFDLIAKARKLTTKPILAKGIHATDSDITRAVESGADKVLVVGRMPGVYQAKCIIEPNTIEELTQLPQNVKQVVWNARDLATGMPKQEVFALARESWSGWLCQASYIQTASDVLPNVDAVLVGEHLEEFISTL